MKKNKNLIIGLLVIVILTTVVMYFNLKDDYQIIIELFQKASLSILIICLLLNLLGHWFSGLTIRNLIQITIPTFSKIDAFKSRILEQFSRGVTPYQTGGQAMQCYALSKMNVPLETSVFALSVEFIIYQFSSIIFQMFFIILYLPKFTQENWLMFGVIVGTTINSAIFVILILLIKWKGLHHFISHKFISFLSKIKIIKNKESSISSLQSKIDDFSQQVFFMKQQKTLVFKNIILELLNLTIIHLSPFLIAMALQVEVSFNDVFLFMAMSIFVNSFNALIPIPGATGGTEAIFILAFSLIISSTPLIKSIMIGWRFITYYIFIIIGAIYLFVFNLKTSKKIEKK